MRAYLARRVLLLAPTLFGVTLATFLMLRLTPGDPVQIMLGEFGSRERVIELRRELGLDRPMAVQYFRFAERVIRGDLGTSIRSRRAVSDEIIDRLPSTVTLTLAAMTFAVCLGVPIGIVAATTKRPAVDSAVMAFALLGLSMPSFWSGLLLILFFSLKLGLFPITEAQGLRALVLPAVTLAAPALAVLARITRSSMLEVLRHEYVRTARSKGLAERLVVYRHALPNALIPVLTIIGLQFGGQLAGAVIVESVFARPGLGRLAVNAILARDFPVVQGIVLVIATMYVFVNLVVDVLYVGLDPRIRYR
jgi:peptide/nickel transport system permease protein/oligopeptide transport system permease protein